ncbi:DUF4062 domain-containing protein [Vibrio diazotrophicus]|uniref:DUF4062 domain-containing protein n=1 Tax=Vibrio diazotrophicus TaxID=685 RepID=UPI0015E146FF|nr:DUF4062 domain-containing protein [Vibrio diazotrophicus]
MATPKVFVSSTCYDLQEERAQLERFISNYGFQPILSEFSGVYYNPDEHTHESCVKEVNHCDLFVLIISGRFGGKLKDGNGESITQAEYNEARRLKIPVFAFVKSDVLAAQLYYKENLRTHDEQFAKKINYPAINKQNDAVDIFNFIQQVQRSQTNNAIEPYTSFTDIENHLKRQWAGMFYSFLQKRDESDKVSSMSAAIEKLIGSTSILESLVESLHTKNVGEQETKDLILHSEIRQSTFNFYKILTTSLGTTIANVSEPQDEFDSPELIEEPLQISLDEIEVASSAKARGDWLEYVENTRLFFVDENLFTNGHVAIRYRFSDLFTPLRADDVALVKRYYETGVKHASKEMVKEVLIDIFTKHLVLNMD